VGISITAGFLGAVSLSEANQRQKKVDRETSRREVVEQAVRSNQARKARREQVREARIRRAKIENETATSGQTDSSAAIAAGDSLTARLGTNIGTINTKLLSDSAISSANTSVLNANRKSNAELISDAGLSFVGSL